MTDTPADPPPWITGPPEGYVPPPVETLRDPAIQVATNERGRALVREVIATIPARSAEPGDHCADHPDQPGGKTGAGDPWCGDCRRAERTEGESR